MPGLQNVKRRVPNQISFEQQTVTADGAILIPFAGTVVIAKTGTLAALTLAAPSAADVGNRIAFHSVTALAHTVTQTTPGFNNAGAAQDVATFGGAIGDGFEVEVVLIGTTPVYVVRYLRNVTLA